MSDYDWKWSIGLASDYPDLQRFTNLSPCPTRLARGRGGCAVASSPSATLPSTSESALAWKLRGAWAQWHEVVIKLPRVRVRGFVEHVAPSSAFALVWDGQALVHVPLGRALLVRRPHFHEPTDGEAVFPRRRAPRLDLPFVHPGQLALPMDGDQS